MHLIESIFNWAEGLPPLGLYLFTFAWLFVESTGFPISDEPLLLICGYLTTVGRIELVPVIIIALVGKVLASCVAFWIGHFLDLERVARPEKQPADGAAHWLWYIRPTRALITATEDRFRKQGAWGVFLGRLIPVVRSFISYPAGAARMPFPIFLTATTAGSLIWIVTWTVLGSVLGKSYQTALDRWGSVSIYVLLGFVLLLVAAWLWNHRRAEAAAHQLEAERKAREAAKAKQSPTTHARSASRPTNAIARARPAPAKTKKR